MVATFSPHRDAGGTLQLHSPSSIHHIDALADLRRSLSRSPSKNSDLRSYSARSQSPSSRNLPFSPSPLSPRRSTSDNFLPLSGSASQSPLAIPFPPSAKIHRPAMRRVLPPQGTPRARTSPKSPSKRVLADSASKSNVTPVPFRTRRSFEKAYISAETQTTDDKENEGSLEVEKVPRSVLKRHSGNFSNTIATSSPLKRSDGIMNMDQSSHENPSAKRRSLHGAPFGPDFNIFDLEGKLDGEMNAESQGSLEEAESGSFSSGNNIPQQFSSIPKRSSSLRKSTLQQRQHERPGLFKRGPGGETSSHSPLIFTASLNPKTKQRMSLDSHLAPIPRDSPFSTGVLPNASIHVVSSQPSSQPLRHPLSRTMTQSSSSSSIMEDSPTHEPIHKLERPRPSIDFSKSLPIGAARPIETHKQSAGNQESSSQGSFATPASYKFARPLPAAFMSTGLISKKNRNVEEPQGGLPKAHMPDTPCKRFSGHFTPGPEAKQEADPRLKEVRQSFGTPATPNLFGGQSGQFSYPPGATLFSKSAQRSLVRRASFVSIDGDDKASSQSPTARPGSQSTTDSDFPPTPTKQAFGQTPGSAQQNFPAQIARGSGSRNTNTNIPLITTSPGHTRFGFTSPRTPQESLIPPDPSGLSISAHNEHPTLPNPSSSASVMPATPTASREYFPTFGARPSLPLSGIDAVDVDASLNSRFEKVEIIGTGEFSQVYRVTQQADNSPFHPIFSLSTSRSGSQASLPERVWAVKKSKHPYTGAKDRQKKIHEVDVLKNLGQNDHIISFVDSWEDRNHLYIQTEFCEEGSLDLFLAQVGLKARLDDFRIWKILLELSQGLKHIHDHGFIHLDLKPANILITFEGVLKIADFGMATKWPATAGIEGEGDREYIGPEILKGQYDKPADIFALGLIMLETAGNVELPDNGVSWQKLRNGDMSDVPSLTWSSEASNICRDVSGNPLSREPSLEDMDTASIADEPHLTESPSSRRERLTHGRKSIHMARSGELTEPPAFMVDPSDEQALDRIVRWMISPDPADRPRVDSILRTTGVQWADVRRRAGATVFEGNWGPADEVLAEDAEMIDV